MRRFHDTVVKAVAEAVGIIAEKTALKSVALSGGTWLNPYLLLKPVLSGLRGEGCPGRRRIGKQEIPGATDSAAIGVARAASGNVYLRTRLGGTRRLKMLSGTPLPRIC
ncbi:MAG: hypothetical protein AB1767_07210 [Bacillota bacterium]